MEINKYTSGLVVSGYRLSDMYYRELSENLPKYFDILLIGSASAVSDNPSGLMSLTTPLKVFDLVNTVETMIRQIDRRLKQDKRKPKKRSEREENYIHNAKTPFDGPKQFKVRKRPIAIYKNVAWTMPPTWWRQHR